ncbi:hypothetical protein [Streptomyces sp. Y7]
MPCERPADDKVGVVAASQPRGGSDIVWVNNLYIRGGERIAGVPDC